LKVSFITLLGIESYGSILQTLATQKKLEEYADNVEVINCVQNERIADAVRGRRNPIKIAIALFAYACYKKNYCKFKKRYLNLSSNKYRTERDFESFPNNSDAYFTGSDQIWNIGCVSSMFYKARFLGFLPKESRKFAYSSSFGNDIVDDADVAKSKMFIEQFEKISVRESGGIKILTEQYGYQGAIRLVDPTLAMPPEFWRNYAPKPKLRNKYILIFTLSKDKNIDRYANKISEITGVPLVRICVNPYQLTGPGKKLFFPTYFKFITLIDNAEFVVTDSFHGTAFAMNLNTEPIAILPKGRRGRLSDFLKLVGNEHRIISDFNDFDVLNRPTDFENANRVLAQERVRVDEFLGSVFQSVEGSKL